MTIFDRVFDRFGYQPKQAPIASPIIEKAKEDFQKDREGYAQNPLAMAFNSINTQWGLRSRVSQITLQTLRRMSRANWVDRTCIFTLRDEIARLPWDIAPIDPKKPFNEDFQQFLLHLLHKPNPNRENWRTFIDKTIEDILVVDAGCWEKVRDGKGRVVELYTVDGATVKPCFDVHGVAGDPAYEQYLPDQKQKDPVATWSNEDLVYIIWNPQGAVDAFGYGMSPVEAGLAVGTAFLYAEAYNLGFFRQNSIPPVVINMGKDVPTGEVNRFQSFLASEMMGEGGFHKPIVGAFGEGWDIKELLKNPTEMGFKEYVEWQMRWKVALYRMNPQDIGFALDQYKAEGQVQQQLSKNKAIDSLKGVISDYINTEIICDTGYGDLCENLQFQWIDTETVDPLKQAQIDEIYIKNGKMTIDEVRRRDGQDPIEGGDKALIVLGSQVVPLSSVEDTQQANLAATQNLANKQPERQDSEKDQTDSQTKKSYVKKNFNPTEGIIVALLDNQTAVAWMDDRGVTQPLFVADYGKKQGFAIKPSFLDERKDQEPPEEKVAEILRLYKVNTPEVKILSEDEVLKLLPTHLYADFTKWLNVQVPYDSKTWRDRWGSTRKSPYYIVSGLLTGKDLGNEELQTAMKTTPDAYAGAVEDLARVWLSEWRFKLGDRKPGHYLITDNGNGFGVDYQFYQDEASWEKTHHFLPDVLGLIEPSLLEAFEKAVRDQAVEFGIEKAVEKALYDWQSTQLDFPPEIADKIVTFGRSIPDDQIFVDPQDSTKGREDDIHVSVLYGLANDVTVDQVEEALRGVGEIEVKLGKVSMFEGDGYDVFKIDVESQSLRSLNAKINKEIGAPGNEFDTYRPHVTIAYLKKGYASKYLGDTRFEGITVNFKTLSFCTNDGQQIPIPLTLDLDKAFRPQATPDKWQAMPQAADIERKLATKIQRKITRWYKRAVVVKNNSVVKADAFDPNQSYLVGAEGVYQNGKRYPLSVLGAKAPTAADLALSAADYRQAFDFGAGQVVLTLETRFPDIKVQNPKLYAPMFENRVNLLSDSVDDSMKRAIDQTIVRGIDSGKTYGEIAQDIQQTLGVDPENPTFPGWRAERIARTESMWAINEGMVNQYKEVGIQKVDIEPASTACEQCMSLADGNPYSVDEASGLIPAHSNCRCVWVGDYSDLLKGLPNVPANPDKTGFIDEDALKHPVAESPAFTSFGELVEPKVRKLVEGMFALLAQKPDGEHAPLEELSDYANMKVAISFATNRQQENPKDAYAVIVRPDGMGKVRYVIYRYREV